MIALVVVVAIDQLETTYIRICGHADDKVSIQDTFNNDSTRPRFHAVSEVLTLVHSADQIVCFIHYSE